MSKANRKDVSIGPDYVGDRINLTAAQVLQVCDFDCNNSVMFVDGKLRRRLLQSGAPLRTAFWGCFRMKKSPENIGLMDKQKKYIHHC